MCANSSCVCKSSTRMVYCDVAGIWQPAAGLDPNLTKQWRSEGWAQTTVAAWLAGSVWTLCSLGCGRRTRQTDKQTERAALWGQSCGTEWLLRRCSVWQALLRRALFSIVPPGGVWRGRCRSMRSSSCLAWQLWTRWDPGYNPPALPKPTLAVSVSLAPTSSIHWNSDVGSMTKVPESMSTTPVSGEVNG